MVFRYESSCPVATFPLRSWYGSFLHAMQDCDLESTFLETGVHCELECRCTPFMTLGGQMCRISFAHNLSGQLMGH